MGANKRSNDIRLSECWSTKAIMAAMMSPIFAIGDGVVIGAGSMGRPNIPTGQRCGG
jgi:hypothetical protein